MKIEIRSDQVLVKNIPARGDKVALQFNEQLAAILDPNGGWPKPFKITLPTGAHPYRPGIYTLSPESFVTTEYEQLRLARDIKLIPIDDKAPAKTP
jgi:hypothetical protein